MVLPLNLEDARMSSFTTRTDRTDRQLAMLPRWAQDHAVSEALDAAKRYLAEGESGPFSFQSALENTLDMVFADDHVFTRIAGKVSIDWARDIKTEAPPSRGTIVYERAS